MKYAEMLRGDLENICISETIKRKVNIKITEKR